MGYQVNKQNGCIFTLEGEVLALAIIEDMETKAGYFVAGLFKLMGDGQWNMIGGPIKEGITDTFIMSHGSMWDFFQKVVWPGGTEKLQEYRKQIVVKPDPSNKVACAQYNTGLDTEIDKVNFTFGPNKQPPLSHAR